MNEFIKRDELLLAGSHVLEHHFVLRHFVAAYYSHERNLLAVRITHLFLHLRRFGINLYRNTFCP